MDKISNFSLGQLNKLQVNSMIMKFIENPELVVWMSIQHRVKENNSVEARWCQANVVGLDKINRSNLKQTSFDIVYDGEPDDVFSFPLISDFEHGDDILLVWVKIYYISTFVKIDIVKRNVKNIYLQFVWACKFCLKFSIMLSKEMDDSRARRRRED